MTRCRIRDACSSALDAVRHQSGRCFGMAAGGGAAATGITAAGAVRHRTISDVAARAAMTEASALASAAICLTPLTRLILRRRHAGLSAHTPSGASATRHDGCRDVYRTVATRNEF